MNTLLPVKDYLLKMAPTGWELKALITDFCLHSFV